jgi:hypothetical protein
MARLNQFAVPRTLWEVQVMLGDEENNEYPVWQHGGVAGAYTMATALFCFNNGTVQIFTGNPKMTPPAIELPLLL